jgi:membrane-associated phospholipid phosphatase
VWGASALVANAGTEHCRWCSTNPLDHWARTELRWSDPSSAGRASDVLQLVVDLGCGTAVAWSAATAGTSRWEIVEDLVAFGEALLATEALTAAAKTATARLRPDAWATGGATTSTDVHSFFSGHTSIAFASASAATQITRLRGRPAWRWIAVFGFVGASATGWLRIASDEHWLTDVLAGAAVGTAVGVTVPLLVLRPAPAQPVTFTLAPAPGGLAVAAVF